MTFESVVKRVSPTLKRITRKLNGHHSFFDDDDLYQEALVHLWNTYTLGAIEDKTDSYILQGCYYYLRNYLRKVRERVVVVSLNDPLGEDDTLLEETLSSEGVAAFDYLEGKLSAEAVIKQSCLSDREQEVLALLMEGMTVRETGGRLGISHVMVIKIKNRISEKYMHFNASSNNSKVHMAA
jgi:RNA polymerase sigma factor (sigma-70 family)